MRETFRLDAEDAFGSYHPIINFIMFACAMALGMFVRHPAFLILNLAFSASYYLTAKRKEGLALILGLVPVFAALSALNPLFNTMGDTVLFTYWGGRVYTLEALFYGMTTAAIFVSMLLWFASYNAIMTSDKFTYLFGSVAPAASLVFTMVLRLIPSFQRKTSQLVVARACIGKGSSGGIREKIRHGASLISALTSLAFEGAITTSDSMRSRGYGTAKRVPFSIYRFDARDKALLAWMVVLVTLTVTCFALGAAEIEIIPTIILLGPTPLFWTGLVAYALFLSLPSVINIRESVIWHISLSRI